MKKSHCSLRDLFSLNNSCFIWFFTVLLLQIIFFLFLLNLNIYGRLFFFFFFTFFFCFHFFHFVFFFFNLYFLISYFQFCICYNYFLMRIKMSDLFRFLEWTEYLNWIICICVLLLWMHVSIYEDTKIFNLFLFLFSRILVC